MTRIVTSLWSLNFESIDKLLEETLDLLLIYFGGLFASVIHCILENLFENVRWVNCKVSIHNMII